MPEEREETSGGSAGACPFAGSVEAHVLGEIERLEKLEKLEEGEGAAFERHLETCPACRDDVAATREVLARLRALPVEKGRDLTPDIMARIPPDAWSPDAWSPDAWSPDARSPDARSEDARSEDARSDGACSSCAVCPPPRPSRWLPLAAGAAACLAAAVVIGLVVKMRPEPGEGDTGRPAGRHAVVARALDWLASTQEADGSWAAERWGGQPNFTVGLTGLAVLSLLAKEDALEPLEGPRAGSIRRAADYIVSSQARDGGFGPRFSGASYNHGIASVALIEYYALARDESLEAPVERALRHIRAAQTSSGGWGYQGGRQVNTAISAWQLNALLLAGSLGWEDARPAAEKGLAWLSGMVDSEGRAGYDAPGSFLHGPEGPTAMAAFLISGAGDPGGGATEKVALGFERVSALPWRRLDYCRSYFFAYARRAVEDARRARKASDPSGGPGELGELAGARAMLLESQVTEGPNSGSFEPLDRWSLTGGRVYATAMAALSLQAEERAPRLLAMMRAAPHRER